MPDNNSIRGLFLSIQLIVRVKQLFLIRPEGESQYVADLIEWERAWTDDDCIHLDQVLSTLIPLLTIRRAAMS